ncbi:ABC transporter substrate-binding protein [Paraburkholderia strydomiana]|uniref:ABC transporter substrate-binding protein n=1 Tax=Paraburkholderia strydomiana TaxID=1245417 RepID=A0ABW9ERS2_9BURK
MVEYKLESIEGRDMETLNITVAATVTDRSQPLLDGRVSIAGCRVTPLPGQAQSIFRGVLTDFAYDIAELSMASYLVATSRGDFPYIAIPVFLSRCFRHGCVYIRKDRGIATGADLAGKRVGMVQYQQTAAVWVRGILRDECGLDTNTVKWHTGGLETPDDTGERVLLHLPPDVSLQRIDCGKTLNQMFADGQLDALISTRTPSSLAKHSDVLGRLFPDHVDEEKAYFRRTGIFPIMHVVVIRRELCDRFPWLPVETYKAFLRARAEALYALTQTNINRVSLAWAADDFARTQAVLGRKLWAYGLPDSRHEIDTLIRYAQEDGLLAAPLDADGLFHPGTLLPPDIEDDFRGAP